MNSSIVVTILKTKSLRVPLNIFHQSLLFLNCLITVPDVITSSIFIPVLMRYCECDQLTSSIFLIINLLYAVYLPLNLAFLGVFQLLIITGKRRCVTFKSTVAAIIACTAITVLLTIKANIITNEAQNFFLGGNVCPRNMTKTKFNGLLISFVIYVVICFIPSVLSIVLTTTWSCVVFKNSYTGDDDGLKRRMLSLPLVYPIAIILPLVVSVAITEIAGRQCGVT